jgi:hypothetical protein
LIKVLDRDETASGEEATWEDIVYYVAKAKAMHRLANRAVQRRTEAVYDATGTPEQTSWTGLLDQLRRARDSREPHPLDRG